MFIGHFVAAELLHDISPGTPTWVALAGVSFPDLLWGVTVLTGVEEVELDPASPLQSTIMFVRYPYSHSLVLGGAIACIPSLVLALIFGPVAGLVFIVGSVSHWLLDTVVHLPDLPVLVSTEIARSASDFGATDASRWWRSTPSSRPGPSRSSHERVGPMCWS